MYLAPPEDLGGLNQVAPTPVRARADDRLIDVYVPHLTQGSGVAGQVGEGDLRFDVGYVDLDDIDIFGIFVRGIGLVRTLGTLGHIRLGDGIHRE